MEVRFFNKEEDYETLCEWWNDWGLPNHHQDALSNTGLIVSKNGVDICSGFVYSTDSYIAWIEFITMNKRTTKSQRLGAIDLLCDSLIKQAKEMGFKLVMAFGLDSQDNVSPILAKYRRENLRDKVVNNISQYYKILT